MTDDRSDSRVVDVPQAGLLDALADATGDVIWLFTADRKRVAFVSDGYEGVFGQAAERPADMQAFVDRIHPDDREEFRDLIAAATDGESRELEARIDATGTDDRWLRIRARPVTDGGDVTHVACSAREVTEHKRCERELERARARLEESNEELQRFAYVVSHDLQEPLRMVSSYMSLLDAEYADELDEGAREYVDFAADGAERMKALIDGLLRFSRVDTRGDEMASVDANEALTDAEKALGVRIDESDASIDAEPLPTVTADRAQLSEVFEILLSNAIEYTEETPTIEVRAEEREASHVFAVEDDGVGIPDAEQADIFGIFERGADATGDGIGIELAIAERIAERHGGEMWVDSAPGEGTTMYFSLAKRPESAP